MLIVSRSLHNAAHPVRLSEVDVVQVVPVVVIVVPVSVIELLLPRLRMQLDEVTVWLVPFKFARLPAAVMFSVLLFPLIVSESAAPSVMLLLFPLIVAKESVAVMSIWAPLPVTV